MTDLDTTRWVPPHGPDWETQLTEVVQALRGLRVAVLTGAGCSTESGIPDYRGEGTAQRARNPIQFRAFLQSEVGRKRYWARSMVGWPRFRTAQPNRAHLACAALEAARLTTGIITQNVDGLHQLAGAKNVVELHGALREVVCLSCRNTEPRDELQARLEQANPGFLKLAHEMAPDGDADIGEWLVDRVKVAECTKCGGIMKPNVVFFGEGVPGPLVERAWEVFRASDALIVAGSSLTVFSGYRFARQAARENKPLFIINIGPTRADGEAAALVRGQAGPALEALAQALVPLP